MEFGAEWGFRGHAQERINVVFRVWLISLGSTVERLLYLNPHERVNTILTHFLRLRHATRDSDVVRPLHSALRQRARAVVRSRIRTDPSAPVADRENLGSGRALLRSRWRRGARPG